MKQFALATGLLFAGSALAEGVPTFDVEAFEAAGGVSAQEFSLTHDFDVSTTGFEEDFTGADLAAELAFEDEVTNLISALGIEPSEDLANTASPEEALELGLITDEQYSAIKDFESIHELD